MITRFCLSLLNPGSDPEAEQWFNDLNESKDDKEAISAKTSAGYSAIYYAVKTGNIEAVEKLVKLGVTLNDQYDEKLTLRDVVQQELIRRQESKEEDYKQYQVIDTILEREKIAFNEELLEKFKKDAAAPRAQDWVGDLLQGKGYSVVKDRNKRGWCFGVANMGAQAFLLEERDEKENLIHLNNFANRVKRVKAAKDIYHDIEVSRHKRILLVDLARNKPEELVKLKKEEKVLPQAMPFKDEVSLAIDPFLSKEDKINLEMDPFLEGVQIFQRIHHEELKEFDYQSSIPGFNLVPNIALEEQGGAVIVDHFDEDYSKKEDLIAFLSKIKELAKKNEYKHPIVFTFSTKEHAITIGYDPKREMWHIIDANIPEYTAFEYSTPKGITEAVVFRLKTALNNNDKNFNVSVNILSTAANAREMQKKIIEPSHKGFLERHKVPLTAFALIGVGLIVSALLGGLPAAAMIAVATIGGLAVGLGLSGFVLDLIPDPKIKSKGAALDAEKHLKASIEKYEKRCEEKQKNKNALQSSTDIYLDALDSKGQPKKQVEKKNRNPAEDSFTEPLLERSSRSSNDRRFFSSEATSLIRQDQTFSEQQSRRKKIK